MYENDQNMLCDILKELIFKKNTGHWESNSTVGKTGGNVQSFSIKGSTSLFC